MLRVEQFLGNSLNLAVLRKHLSNVFREIKESIDNFSTAGSFGKIVVGKLQCNHGERNILAGVCFRGCNTDLWSSIDMNTALSLSTDRRTNSICNTKTQCPTVLAICQSQQRILCLARLGYENTNIITEYGNLSSIFMSELRQTCSSRKALDSSTEMGSSVSSAKSALVYMYK